MRVYLFAFFWLTLTRSASQALPEATWSASMAGISPAGACACGTHFVVLSEEAQQHHHLLHFETSVHGAHSPTSEAYVGSLSLAHLEATRAPDCLLVVAGVPSDAPSAVAIAVFRVVDFSVVAVHPLQTIEGLDVSVLELWQTMSLASGSTILPMPGGDFLVAGLGIQLGLTNIGLSNHGVSFDVVLQVPQLSWCGVSVSETALSLYCPHTSLLQSSFATDSLPTAFSGIDASIAGSELRVLLLHQGSLFQVAGDISAAWAAPPPPSPPSSPSAPVGTSLSWTKEDVVDGVGPQPSTAPSMCVSDDVVVFGGGEWFDMSSVDPYLRVAVDPQMQTQLVCCDGAICGDAIFLGPQGGAYIGRVQSGKVDTVVFPRPLCRSLVPWPTSAAARVLCASQVGVLVWDLETNAVVDQFVPLVPVSAAMFRHPLQQGSALLLETDASGYLVVDMTTGSAVDVPSLNPTCKLETGSLRQPVCRSGNVLYRLTDGDSWKVCREFSNGVLAVAFSQDRVLVSRRRPRTAGGQERSMLVRMTYDCEQIVAREKWGMVSDLVAVNENDVVFAVNRTSSTLLRWARVDDTKIDYGVAIHPATKSWINVSPVEVFGEERDVLALLREGASGTSQLSVITDTKRRHDDGGSNTIVLDAPGQTWLPAVAGYKSGSTIPFLATCSEFVCGRFDFDTSTRTALVGALRASTDQLVSLFTVGSNLYVLSSSGLWTTSLPLNVDQDLLMTRVFDITDPIDATWVVCHGEPSLVALSSDYLLSNDDEVSLDTLPRGIVGVGDQLYVWDATTVTSFSCDGLANTSAVIVCDSNCQIHHLVSISGTLFVFTSPSDGDSVCSVRHLADNTLIASGVPCDTRLAALTNTSAGYRQSICETGLAPCSLPASLVPPEIVACMQCVDSLFDGSLGCLTRSYGGDPGVWVFSNGTWGPDDEGALWDLPCQRGDSITVFEKDILSINGTHVLVVTETVPAATGDCLQFDRAFRDCAMRHGPLTLCVALALEASPQCKKLHVPVVGAHVSGGDLALECDGCLWANTEVELTDGSQLLVSGAMELVDGALPGPGEVVVRGTLHLRDAVVRSRILVKSGGVFFCDRCKFLNSVDDAVVVERGGEATIRNSSFVGVRTGMSVLAGGLAHLQDSVFESCGVGGRVLSVSGTLHMSGCDLSGIISGDTVTSSHDKTRLVVANDGGRFEASDSRFNNGSTAVVTRGSFASFSHCNFTGNTHGAIRASHAAEVFVEQTAFSENTAEHGGAIFAGDGTNLTLVDVYFVHNRARGNKGGALKTVGASVNASDVRFVGNEATQGAGLYISGSSAMLRDVRCEENQGAEGVCLMLEWPTNPQKRVSVSDLKVLAQGSDSSMSLDEAQVAQISVQCSDRRCPVSFARVNLASGWLALEGGADDSGPCKLPGGALEWTPKQDCDDSRCVVLVDVDTAASVQVGCLPVPVDISQSKMSSQSKTSLQVLSEYTGTFAKDVVPPLTGFSPEQHTVDTPICFVDWQVEAQSRPGNTALVVATPRMCGNGATSGSMTCTILGAERTEVLHGKRCLEDPDALGTRIPTRMLNRSLSSWTFECHVVKETAAPVSEMACGSVGGDRWTSTSTTEQVELAVAKCEDFEGLSLIGATPDPEWGCRPCDEGLIPQPTESGWKECAAPPLCKGESRPLDGHSDICGCSKTKPVYNDSDVVLKDCVSLLGPATWESVCQIDCGPCMTGMVCPQDPGPPSTAEGFYPGNGNPEVPVCDPFMGVREVTQCNYPGNCPGNQVLNCSLLHGGYNCAKGHTGTLCEKCIDGFFWDDKGCSECPSEDEAWIFLAVVVVIIVAIVLLSAAPGLTDRLPCCTPVGRFKMPIPRMVGISFRALSAFFMVSAIDETKSGFQGISVDIFSTILSPKGAWQCLGLPGSGSAMEQLVALTVLTGVVTTATFVLSVCVSRRASAGSSERPGRAMNPLVRGDPDRRMAEYVLIKDSAGLKYFNEHFVVGADADADETPGRWRPLHVAVAEGTPERWRPLHGRCPTGETYAGSHWVDVTREDVPEVQQCDATREDEAQQCVTRSELLDKCHGDVIELRGPPPTHTCRSCCSSCCEGLRDTVSSYLRFWKHREHNDVFLQRHILPQRTRAWTRNLDSSWLYHVLAGLSAVVSVQNKALFLMFVPLLKARQCTEIGKAAVDVTRDCEKWKDESRNLFLIDAAIIAAPLILLLAGLLWVRVWDHILRGGPPDRQSLSDWIETLPCMHTFYAGFRTTEFAPLTELILHTANLVVLAFTTSVLTTTNVQTLLSLFIWMLIRTLFTAWAQRYIYDIYNSFDILASAVPLIGALATLIVTDNDIDNKTLKGLADLVFIIAAVLLGVVIIFGLYVVWKQRRVPEEPIHSSEPVRVGLHVSPIGRPRGLVPETAWYVLVYHVPRAEDDDGDFPKLMRWTSPVTAARCDHGAGVGRRGRDASSGSTTDDSGFQGTQRSQASQATDSDLAVDLLWVYVYADAEEAIRSASSTSASATDADDTSQIDRSAGVGTGTTGSDLSRSSGSSRSNSSCSVGSSAVAAGVSTHIPASPASSGRTEVFNEDLMFLFDSTETEGTELG